MLLAEKPTADDITHPDIPPLAGGLDHICDVTNERRETHPRGKT
jgi:hypothetical protein